MPLLKQVLLATQGYIELGMLDDAHAELDRLGPKGQALPEVLECRIFLHMQLGQWSDGALASERLRTALPDNQAACIHGAYCLHELGRTLDARDLLLAGPQSLRGIALYHYNLACYEAILGHEQAALRHLARSFDLDKNLPAVAREDKDLASLLGKF